MISAHSATVQVDNDRIRIRYSGLASALRGDNNDYEDIALSSVTGTELTAPTAFESGNIRVRTQVNGADTIICFSPNQQDAAQNLVDAIEAALSGNSPASRCERELPGLSGVTIGIEKQGVDWDSVTHIRLARITAGQLSDSAEFAVEPAAEALGQVLEYIGEGPIIAHNAYYQVSALCQACAAAGLDIPTVLVGCTLALYRAVEPDVADHSLSGAAQRYGFEGTPAEQTAQLLIRLAQEAMPEDGQGLMDLFHGNGFALGAVNKDSVVPVLLDRTGAGRALQKRGITSATPGTTGGAGTDFQNTTPHGAKDKAQAPRRGQSPAPWQSVATPDEIPVPNPEADPQDPLFGQVVVLTGEFDPFDKGRVWAEIAQRGGQVAKNVTKKTTLLGVGDWGTKTSKEKKAEEYRNKGQAIEIWSRDKLLSALGLDADPPF